MGGLGVSQGRTKIGGLANGFREGIDLASPRTQRWRELRQHSEMLEANEL